MFVCKRAASACCVSQLAAVCNAVQSPTAPRRFWETHSVSKRAHLNLGEKKSQKVVFLIKPQIFSARANVAAEPHQRPDGRSLARCSSNSWMLEKLKRPTRITCQEAKKTHVRVHICMFPLQTARSEQIVIQIRNGVWSDVFVLDTPGGLC